MGATLLLAVLFAMDPGTRFASAIEGGDLKAVSALLDEGLAADTPIGEGDAGHTPLQRAAWNGRTEIAKLLIARGADVNARSSVHGSPLHAATARGWDDLVAALLEAGAAVDQRDERGNRPLFAAINGGNRDLTTLLLEAGARVEESGEGYTPLMYAAMNDDAEMIRLLVKAGAKVNAAAKGQYGRVNPLLVAVDRGCAEAVKALVEAKADVNASNAAGESALKLAQASGNEAIVTLLKTAGARDAAVSRRKP